jgi:MFS transporter, PPP family, 3-phenylpropionic acid transporter
MPKTDRTHTGDAAVAASAISLYGGIFVLTGTQLPYFPLWLEHQGFAEAEIATILGLPMFLRAVAPPMVTAIADRFGILPVLAACNIGAGFACFGLLQFDGFAATLILSLCLGFLLAPTAALIDTIVGLSVDGRPRLSYGQIRGAGSVAFMLTNILVALALPHMAADMIVVIMMSAALAAALALLPASRHLITSGRKREEAQAASAPVAGGIGILAALICAYALMQSAHAFLYAFGSIEWRRQGISDAAMGAAWASGVAAEIVMFYWLGSRIRTARSAGILLVIGGLGGTLRWLIYAQPLPNGLWPLVQMAHAISFAAPHLGMVMLANLLAPPGRRAFTQGAAAGAAGATMAVATLFSDDFYTRLGAGAYYASALIAFAGGLIALYATSRLQPQSAPSGGLTVPPS